MVLFITSTDIFDTVSNAFRRRKDVKIRAHFAIKKHFYQLGGKLSYWEYAGFLTFVVLSLSFFYPLAGGVAAGCLAFFGASYWYSHPELSFDPATELYSIAPDKWADGAGMVFGMVFFIGTGIVLATTL